MKFVGDMLGFEYFIFHVGPSGREVKGMGLRPFCSWERGFESRAAVAARSKAWVCGRSVPGNVGSNPARGT